MHLVDPPAPRDRAASSTRRLAALALIAASLVPLGGCWPLAPIVVVAAAAGGGGGGGGGKGTPAAALSGTIVTSGTVFDTSLERLDREPNDSMGTAYALGPVSPGAARRLSGTTGVRASLHALVGSGERVDVLRRELLEGGAGDERRFQVGSAARPPPVAIARDGKELLLLDVVARRASVRATPLGGLLTKRRLELGLDVEPAGFASGFDALLVLDRSQPGIERLVAFDAEDGAPLSIDDLGRGGLAHLAGGEELLTGRARLFTCSPRDGELFEIAVSEAGSDRRFGGLVARGTLRGLDGPIAALAYDGALLHVVDGGGTLRSFDPDTLRELASRPLLAAGERALSLAVELDLGYDGWQIELPPGASLRVELAAAGARPDARFFLAAIDRATATQRLLASPPPLRTSGAPAEVLALDLSAPADRPRSFDVVVGALRGGGSYELALGAAARRPRSPSGEGPAREVAAAELAGALDLGFVGRLAAARLVELYRDPLLSDFVPERLVLGRKVEAAALALPSVPKGLALSAVSRSASGFDVVAVAATPEFAGPAARSLHGTATRRGTRREQSRALLAALDAIAGAPGVAWSEPQYLVHALAVPNDPGFAANQAWHYNLLNLPSAWDVTTGANSTVLACIDTGIRTDNNDLLPQPNGNVGSHGFDFVTGGGGDGNGLDSDPFDPGTFASNAHHGSHTGGTMGARGNNVTQGTGICWNCELMPLRGLDVNGSGSTSDIAEAIRYAARLSNASGTIPPKRAAVINLSLGLPQTSNVLHDAIANAVAQGCVVCCAAGNDGNDFAVLFPAAFVESIAVAATEENGNVAFYSNAGPEVDVTCPGGDDAVFSPVPADEVWSTVGVGPGGSLQPLRGTSMACAHASGVAGLLATVNPALDQNAARDILRFTATDIDAAGVDDLSGFGLVDAAAAVDAAPKQLQLTATSVDFGNTGTHQFVQAISLAGKLAFTTPFAMTATYTPAAAPAPTTSWLTATLMPDGRTIQLTADRTGLVDGDYEVQVDVVSDGGNASFTAGITVDSLGVTDIGDVFVVLLDVDGATVLDFRLATAANGYAWSFAGLPLGNGPSEFFLVAGVDVDGDLVIGEPGEPFGGFPDGGSPSRIWFSPAAPIREDIVVQ
jgi:serine protease